MVEKFVEDLWVERDCCQGQKSLLVWMNDQGSVYELGAAELTKAAEFSADYTYIPLLAQSIGTSLFHSTARESEFLLFSVSSRARSMNEPD